MIENADKWLEEMSSEFIVRTCQLLPESCAFTSNRMHIPMPPPCCLPIWFITYCGSSHEFYIRPVNPCIDDIDILAYRVEELAVVEGSPVLTNDVSRLADTVECYKIEPYFKYPGFVRLRALGTMHYNWKTKKYDFRHTFSLNKYYGIDASEYVVDPFLSAELLDELPSIKRGPAIRCKHLEFETYDHVHSVWCCQWPKEARDWLTRRRDYRWPTTDAISEVVQQGCHVVYALHRSCRHDGRQWRFSFSVAEVILLQSWTKIQQIVYHLLRFFAKRELIQNDCPKEDEVLCTYHLKTLMLWTCEEKPQEWWNSSSVIAICSELLKRLLKWLKSRYCPNYFIPEANLFHNELNPNVYARSERQLNSVCNSVVLCYWFVEKYILPFTLKHLEVEITGTLYPQFIDYIPILCRFQNTRKLLESLDFLFSTGFECRNRLASSIVDSAGLIEPRAFLDYVHSERKMDLLMPCDIPILTIPKSLRCFGYFDATLCSLSVAYELTSGQIAWDSELIADCIQGMSMTPKSTILCQYHIFPIPLKAKRSQFAFLRAQDLMTNFTGSNGRSEAQLLSAMSKELLRESLHCCDSQSNAIAPAALVYLAALYFALSEYQIVIDFCFAALNNQTTGVDIETLNARCLLFIDDVAKIVGISLLYKRFNENTNLNRRRVFLDLRLTFTAFAYHLTVISTERLSKISELNSNLFTSALFLDQLLLVISKRKNCTLNKSSIGFSDVRRCVYRRTDSLKIIGLVPSMRPLNDKETFIEILTEFALESMTSFYIVMCEDFGIQCGIVDCYRALYLYMCRKYDEMMSLCERILQEPDLESDLKEFAFANVLVLPPLDYFFDGDIQSLLGFQTLFYYLSPLYDDSVFTQFFAKFIHATYEQFSETPVHPYHFKCHYFIGRHFLASYLKLRCCIDCNYPFAEEAITEFAAVKSNLPFEHVIRQFILRKRDHHQNHISVFLHH